MVALPMTVRRDTSLLNRELHEIRDGAGRLVQGLHENLLTLGVRGDEGAVGSVAEGIGLHTAKVAWLADLQGIVVQ